MAIRFIDEQPKSKIKFIKEIPFLPRRGDVEQKISQRPDVLGQYMKTIQQPGFLGQAVRKPLQTMQQQLGAGAGLFQRGEAGLAGAGLALQRGEPRRILKEAGKGFAGQRMPEFGDIIRTTGFGGMANEAISSTVGLFAQMGMIDPFTKGTLVQSGNKALNFMKSKIPRIMNKDYVINRAKLGASGLDDLYTGLSREYERAYDKFGNRAVDVGGFQNIVNELPPGVQSNLKRNLNMFQRFNDGSVMHNLRNLKLLKTFIRKAIGDKKVLAGARHGNQWQGDLKYTLGKVRNLEKTALKGTPIENLHRRYAEFMKMNEKLNKVFYDPQGNIRSKGLEGVWKPGAERNVQQFFDDFASMWPQATQIMKDVVKYTGRQATQQGLRKLGGQALKWGPIAAGGGYMGANWLRNMLGGDTGGSSGGY